MEFVNVMEVVKLSSAARLGSTNLKDVTLEDLAGPLCVTERL
jgi:hypothetical protein